MAALSHTTYCFCTVRNLCVSYMFSSVGVCNPLVRFSCESPRVEPLVNSCWISVVFLTFRRLEQEASYVICTIVW
jgi:hypothetical protein